MEGVLKSWAVPKGPSMNPEDKRLAMQVEDHPFEYRMFHGVIPEGNYGAGIVEIWDKGTYVPMESEAGRSDEQVLLRALKKGDLKIVLKGRKLKGAFALVQMKSREANAWLLIKKRDKYAGSAPYDSEAQTTKSSPINKALAKGQAGRPRRRARAA
jgi:bifunctional non-homologous end joining protein LigD